MRFPRAMAACLAVLCLSASAASAALQRWTFQNVAFGDVRNTLTGETLGGGTVTGFFLYDTDTQQLVAWNIFTSPGWANCNVPSAGNVCYTDGLHWTKGNSHVFAGAAFFQLLRGDQNSFPLLDVFVKPTSDPSVMTFDFRNSVEILTDSPDTYRFIRTGSVVLTNPH